MVHQCITECDLLTFRIYIFRKQCDLQSELWQCLPMPCFETDQIQRVYAIYLCFIAVCYICPRFASYPGIKYVVSPLSYKYSSYRSSKFILAPMRVVYISKASPKNDSRRSIAINAGVYIKIYTYFEVSNEWINAQTPLISCPLRLTSTMQGCKCTKMDEKQRSISKIHNRLKFSILLGLLMFMSMAWTSNCTTSNYGILFSNHF